LKTSSIVSKAKRFMLPWATSNSMFNLQATKLFIVTSATKGGGYHPP